MSTLRAPAAESTVSVPCLPDADFCPEAVSVAFVWTLSRLCFAFVRGVLPNRYDRFPGESDEKLARRLPNAPKSPRIMDKERNR